MGMALRILYAKSGTNLSMLLPDRGRGGESALAVAGTAYALFGTDRMRLRAVRVCSFSLSGTDLAYAPMPIQRVVSGVKRVEPYEIQELLQRSEPAGLVQTAPWGPTLALRAVRGSPRSRGALVLPGAICYAPATACPVACYAVGCGTDRRCTACDCVVLQGAAARGPRCSQAPPRQVTYSQPAMRLRVPPTWSYVAKRRCYA
eukprot:595442-Rhodomonas_salina.4